MLSQQRRYRMQSSLSLFLEACRLWGQTFENDMLLCHADEMEEELDLIKMDECSEEMVRKVEDATVQLVDSMDNLLKAMGNPGFCEGKLKH